MARTLESVSKAFPSTEMIFEAPTKEQHFEWYTRKMLPALVQHFRVSKKYPNLAVMLSANWPKDEKVASLINRLVLELFADSDAKHRASYANEMVVFTRNLSMMYSGARLNDEELPISWNPYFKNKKSNQWETVEKAIRNTWGEPSEYSTLSLIVNVPAYSEVDTVNIKGGHTTIWDGITGKIVNIQDKERIISYVYNVWYRTENITLQGIAIGILKYLESKYGIAKRNFALSDTILYIKTLLTNRYHLKLAIDTTTTFTILDHYSWNFVEGNLWTAITVDGFVPLDNPVVITNQSKERSNNAFFNKIGETQTLNNVLYLTFEEVQAVFFGTGSQRFSHIQPSHVVLSGNGFEYIVLSPSSGKAVAGHDVRKKTDPNKPILPNNKTEEYKNPPRVAASEAVSEDRLAKLADKFPSRSKRAITPAKPKEKVATVAQEPVNLRKFGSFHLGAVMSTDDLPPETQKLLDSYMSERKNPVSEEPIKEQIGLELVPTKQPIYVKTDGERGELVKRNDPLIIRSTSSRWTLRKNEDNTYNLYVYVWGLTAGWTRVSTVEDSDLETLLIKVLEN